MSKFVKWFAVAALVVGAAGRADAQVLNGGFEAGNGAVPVNWTLVGDAGRIGALGTINPPQGAFQAFLTTGSSPLVPGDAVAAATVAAAFGLPLTAFPIPAGTFTPLTEGSAILQSGVFANAGDILTFDWNYLTNEGVPTGFDISYAVVVTGPAGGTQVVVLGSGQTPGFISGGTSGFAFQTGYRNGSITFNQTGTYTIGFAVFDTSDTIVDSALLVDNVAITPIPEPTSMALAGMGLVGLAGYGLRRRKAAKA